MTIAFPPKRIIAAVDLSAPSLSALAAAKDIAVRSRGKLEVVYAASPPVPLRYSLDDFDLSAAAAVEAEERRFHKEWTRRVLEACSGLPRRRLHLRWIYGFPAAVLEALARPRFADLFVIGTHGRAGAKRAVLGSIAEAVSSKSRIPVLCVHAWRKPGLTGGILAPYNLQRYADDAVLFADRLASFLKVPLTALYVARPGQTENEAGVLLIERLEGLLGAGRASRARRIVRLGEARSQIAAEAAKGRYSLVILSGHRRATMGDWAFGGTSDRLLRRARSAVLSLPEEPAHLGRPHKRGVVLI